MSWRSMTTSLKHKNRPWNWWLKDDFPFGLSSRAIPVSGSVTTFADRHPLVLKNHMVLEAMQPYWFFIIVHISKKPREEPPRKHWTWTPLKFTYPTSFVNLMSFQVICSEFTTFKSLMVQWEKQSDWNWHPLKRSMSRYYLSKRARVWVWHILRVG